MTKRRLAVAMVFVAIALVGGVRGFLDEDRVRSASDLGRPCSPRAGSHLVLTVEVAEPGRRAVRPRLYATARVDPTLWEVKEARSLANDRTDVYAATKCLFGMPQFARPQITIADGMATVVGRDFFDEPDGCLGPFSVDITARKMTIGLDEKTPKPCDDGSVLEPAQTPLDSPDVDLTVEIRAPGREPFVSPAPTQLTDAVVQWQRPAGPKRLSIHAEMPVERLEYVAAQVDTDSLGFDVGSGRFTLRTYALTGWLPELVLILLIAVAARARSVTATAAVALVLATAVIVNFSPGGWRDYQAAEVVVVATCLGVAAMLSKARWVLRVVAALAAFGAAVLSWDRRLDDPVFGSLVLAAVVPAVFVVSYGLAARLRDATPRRRSDVIPWPAARDLLTVLVLFAAVYTVAQAVGLALGEEDSPFYLDSQSVASAALAFALLAVAAAATSVVNALPDTSELPRRATVVTVLVWATLALKRPVEIASVALPLAPIIATVVLCALLRRSSPTESPPEAGTIRHLVTSLFGGDPRISTPNSWRVTARRSVEIGAVFAVLPVGYFVTAALTDLPARTFYGPGFATLIAGVVHEAGRWLAAAWLFGALYTRLPGRTGPAKASVVCGAWFVGAGMAEIVNHWVAHGSGREWMFAGLQLVPFLFAVAVVLDLLALLGEGRRPGELAAVYGIHRMRGAIAYAAPVVLALVGVAQQVASGSGTDFVKGVLETVGAL